MCRSIKLVAYSSIWRLLCAKEIDRRKHMIITQEEEIR